jgi:hypothetical protein
MGRTQTKGIRLTEAEVARARQLAPLHPSAASEAELLCIIFLRGLLLEEAGLAAMGVLPAGLTEAQLAAGVLSPVLTALQFLNRAGVVGLAAPAAALEEVAASVEGLDEAAAEDVSGLGGAFL